MKRWLTGILFLMLAGVFHVAYSDTAVLTWNAVEASDLKGYKVYQRAEGESYGNPIATLDKNTTTHTLTIPAGPLSKSYFWTVSSFDQSENESDKSNEVNKLIAGLATPATPTLSVSSPSPSTLLVTWPDGDDGTGNPFKIDIRYAPAPIGWGSAISVSCLLSPCVIPGLTPDTAYDVQAVGYRGEMNVSAVFSPLSAVAAGRTMAVPITPVPVPVPTPTPSTDAQRLTSLEATIAAIKKEVCDLKTSSTLRTALRKALGATTGCAK